jgi:hypothetical protein
MYLHERQSSKGVFAQKVGVEIPEVLILGLHLKTTTISLCETEAHD